MTIRRAAAADVEAILRVERASATAPHWNEMAYARAVAGEDGRCVFVEDDDGLRGFAVGVMLGDKAELESVVVAEDSQRQGVGRALCEAVVGWARESGAQTVGLEVRAGSAGAIALYAGLGFRAIGLRQNYYSSPVEEALVMQLRLGEEKRKD